MHSLSKNSQGARGGFIDHEAKRRGSRPDNQTEGTRTARKRRRPAAAIAAMVWLVPVLAITGCASHSKDHFIVGSTSQDTYKTRHPIVIDEKEQTLDIPIATGTYGLPRAAHSAIEGFSERYRTNAAGTVTIMVPSGSSNEHAARAMAPQIIDTITSVGISRSRVRMARYDATQHGSSAPIRLSFMAVKASVEGCGKWDSDLAQDTSQNGNYHNFGCANQSNLAAQLANPADLLGPRGSTPIDATRRNTVIEAYRNFGAGLN